jgi:NAD-dependent deacetylase
VTSAIERLAALFAAARRPVVFSGAGVSTESGIPDFRSPGGMWDRFRAGEMTYAAFLGSDEGRRRYWRFGRAVYPVIRDALPGAAHHAIAELHRLDRLDAVITQNVDDLHRRAGVPADRIIELHGNSARVRCLACGAEYRRDDVHAWVEASDEAPACRACGGIVKPTTVLFGEALPAGAMDEARRRASAADLFVVVGSSLTVVPAAYVPRHATRAGATLVIVNLTPTPLDAEADLVIAGKAGEVMAAVVAEIREARGRAREARGRAGGVHS